MTATADNAGAGPAPSEDAALALGRRFYAAFSRKDGDAMAACYGPASTFCDPAFAELANGDPGRMWQMLCSQATDLAVVLDRIELAGAPANLQSPGLASVQAQWTATYTFSVTGRRVVNVVTSHLQIDRASGLIVRQDDTFDFWKWSRQALGLPGMLLGWTGFLQGKVQKMARGNLKKWAKAQAGAGS